MATPEEVKRDVGAWLREHLGVEVDFEEDFDREEVKLKVSGTRPLQLISLPRFVTDRQQTEDLIAMLEQDQVVELLQSGEHWKGRLTQHGMQWTDD
jgi:hypothetical protein